MEDLKDGVLRQLPARTSFAGYEVSLQVGADDRVRYRDVKDGMGRTYWMTPEDLLDRLLTIGAEYKTYPPTVFRSRGRLYWLKQKSTPAGGTLFRYFYLVEGDPSLRAATAWRTRDQTKTVYELNKDAIDEGDMLTDPTRPVADSLPRVTHLDGRKVVLEEFDSRNVRYKDKSTGSPVTVWKTPDAMRELLDNREGGDPSPFQIGLALAKAGRDVAARLEVLESAHSAVEAGGFASDEEMIEARRVRAAALASAAEAERRWVELADKLVSLGKGGGE